MRNEGVISRFLALTAGGLSLALVLIGAALVVLWAIAEIASTIPGV
jgi:hypothetical protein